MVAARISYWATVAMLTILLLTTAAGGLIGTASGLASFAVNNGDKVSRTRLSAAVQQQIDQFRRRQVRAPTRPQRKLNKPRLNRKPRRHGKWDSALPRAVPLARVRARPRSDLGGASSGFRRQDWRAISGSRSA